MLHVTTRDVCGGGELGQFVRCVTSSGLVKARVYDRDVSRRTIGRRLEAGLTA